jgi:hypothetical protein
VTSPLLDHQARAILAHLPERRRAAVLVRGLPALTRRTITEPVALRRHLGEIRSKGFALASASRLGSPPHPRRARGLPGHRLPSSLATGAPAGPRQPAAFRPHKEMSHDDHS